MDNAAALATFVVEARRSDPSAQDSEAVLFTVHHVEADDTSPALETSGQLAAWIEVRVRAAQAPDTGTSDLPEAQDDQVLGQAQEHGSARRRKARLRLTYLEARGVGTDIASVTPEEMSLLTESPVILDADPVILVSRGTLEGPEGVVARCRIRCRLRALDAQEVMERSWGENAELRAGDQGVEIASPPLTIPAGIYQGQIFFESPNEPVQPVILTLPVIKVG